MVVKQRANVYSNYRVGEILMVNSKAGSLAINSEYWDFDNNRPNIHPSEHLTYRYDPERGCVCNWSGLAIDLKTNAYRKTSYVVFVPVVSYETV